MKKQALSVVIFLFALNVAADDLSGDRITSVQQKVDERGQIYYDLSVSFPLIPIPHDATAAVGYSTSDKKLEAELYAGVRVSRLIARENGMHLPYGTRVRVALDGNSTLYVEFQYQNIANKSQRAGLLEMPGTVSLIKFNGAHDRYIGCGVGKETHYPWSDEVHPPEKSTMISCRAGMRY